MKPKEQQLVKVEAPFIDEISDVAIVKILDEQMESAIMLKLKFVQHLAMLDMMNSSSEIVILDPKEVIGILDLRSLWYYKIQQGVLQQNFEPVENVCNHFNKLINMLKKEETIETGEKFQWLDDTDERKHMSDREILEKYVGLSNSCLKKKEKEEVMDMLCKYKEAFSLRQDRNLH